MLQSGTTHLLLFTIPGEQPYIRDMNVTLQQPKMQRAQMLKSQLPDVKFPPDTETVVMHVDDVSSLHCARIYRELHPVINITNHVCFIDYTCAF